MPQISLSTTGRDPLKFDGNLLVRVTSQRDQTVEGERGYDLYVYSRLKGGFVAAIDFVTTVDGEANQSVVETVDSLADVEDVFFAFEPEELLPPTLRSQLTPAQRQELLQRLYANYDKRVRDVLRQLRTQVSQTTPSASSV